MNNTASKNARGISGLPLSFKNPFISPKGSGLIPTNSINSRPLIGVIIVLTKGSNGDKTPAIRSAVGNKKSLTSEPTSRRKSTMSITGFATFDP